LILRSGFGAITIGIVLLVTKVDVGAGAEIVLIPMVLIGLGIGALASQLGALTVSSVPDSARNEVGGLQHTVTNFGASLGTALARAILIGVLSTTLITGAEANATIPQIRDSVSSRRTEQRRPLHLGCRTVEQTSQD
jgi:MFS family permease